MNETRSHRSIVELFEASLVGDEDDEAAWACVHELQSRGSDDVFELAREALHDAQPRRRGRAADVLAQEGTPRPSDDLKKRCGTALLAALQREQDSAVLAAIATALGHLCDVRAPEALAPLRTHPDANVRLGVVHGLMPHSTDTAIAALIELSRDSDVDVRNWATFGFGNLHEDALVDTPAVRAALVARLADADDETRGEAIVSLAHRKDARARAPLIAELQRGRAMVLHLEAAAILNDATLLPLLQALRRDEPSFFQSVLSETIAALGAGPKTPTTNS